MCLYLTKAQNKLKIVRKDIVVYKGVYMRAQQYFTFFRNYCVKPGDVHVSVIDVIDLDGGKGRVEKGLHTFATLDQACHSMRMRICYQDCPIFIIKCVIPKGAHYYHGEFDWAGDAYASDTLVYTDEITPISKPYIPTDGS